jgi:hypothetical protein
MKFKPEPYMTYPVQKGLQKAKKNFPLLTSFP